MLWLQESADGSARIVLVEGGPRLRANVSEPLSAVAKRALERFGVEVRLASTAAIRRVSLSPMSGSGPTRTCGRPASWHDRRRSGSVVHRYRKSKAPPVGRSFCLRPGAEWFRGVSYTGSITVVTVWGIAISIVARIEATI